MFKNIRWRNFLSTGNALSEVKLNEHNTTLIIGKNGEGKSTILDALTFVLFNKPFRNINRPQLINSINQKNCLVEIEFDIGQLHYKVIRGIKPAIFEIYVNGNLINQDAASKDYQKVLEQQILKLNYKTFTQVVILGSASFVPFMQLPSGQRREVIEDILDISVFSLMNQLLKEKIVSTKDEIKTIEHEFRIITEQAKAQQRLIESLQTSKDQNVKAIKNKIDFNITEINDKSHLIDLINEDIKELNNKLDKTAELDKQFDQCKTSINTIQQKINHTDEYLDFFNNNEICPSCEQGIQHSHKDKIIHKNTKDKKELHDKLTTLNSAYAKLNAELKEKQNLITQLHDKLILVSTENNALNSIIRTNEELKNEIENLSVHGDIASEKDKIKVIAETALNINLEKTKLKESQKIQDIAAILLKDTGIKTTIIKQYLPVMNKLINNYLTAMDFFIKFELDEGFNETIKSRFRDEFTYPSFSEGEKQKIDLALLFTWRKIAKMKNSASTNLLFMDEIADSSLDDTGVENLFNIINTLDKDTNVFIISHRGDVLIDKFQVTLKIQKHNDFSIIV